MAETALCAVARQCPDRRNPHLPTLEREVAEWEDKRKAAEIKVERQFRGRLRQTQKLYPKIELP